jgi:hypothetical protein
MRVGLCEQLPGEGQTFRYLSSPPPSSSSDGYFMVTISSQSDGYFNVAELGPETFWPSRNRVKNGREFLLALGSCLALIYLLKESDLTQGIVMRFASTGKFYLR